MTDVATLMHANLFEVFGERDAARRRAAVDRTYAEGVVFADPEAVVTGRDALDAKAAGLLASAPDFVFTAAGEVMVNHDLGHLAWNLGPEGQPPVVRGLDIALVEDGLITKLWTFLLPS
ncbi:nuclear transport factor 2 family protein [Jatrophihabitans sp. YIM 134969]